MIRDVFPNERNIRIAARQPRHRALMETLAKPKQEWRRGAAQSEGR